MECRYNWKGLVNQTWGNHIPQVSRDRSRKHTSPIKTDLKRLERIVSLIQAEISWGTPAQKLKAVMQKCWEFSLNMPNPSSIIKACKICAKVLEANRELSQDLPFTQAVAFHFKDCAIPLSLPGYYKKALAEASDYFKAMFMSDFAEATSNEIRLEVDKVDFESLLDWVQKKKMPNDIHGLLKQHELFLINDFTEMLAASLKTLTATKDRDFFKAIQIVQYYENFSFVPEKIKNALMLFFSTHLRFEAVMHKKDKLEKEKDTLAKKVEALADIQLDQLELSYMDDESIQKLDLSSLSTLTKLRFFLSNLTGIGLESIKHLKITHLDIHSLHERDESHLLKAKELIHLISMPLKSLKLNSFLASTDEGMEILSPLELESLTLENSIVSNDGLKKINLKGLKTLRLSNCNRITNAGLSAFKDGRLTALRLDCCKKLTDLCMLPFEGMPITSLDLSSSRITDAVFEQIKSLPIESLTAYNCERLTNACLKEIAKMETLKYLDLSLCPDLSDEGLAYLQASHLNQLFIRELNITGKGISFLYGLPLNTLDVSHCVGVSKAAIDSLQIAKPHLRIFFDHL